MAPRILLHLAPGAAVMVAYVALAPALARHGVPTDATLLLAFVAAGWPVMLGVMARAARRGDRPVVAYRERLPWWEYALWLLALVGIAFAALFLLAPVGGALARAGFGWMPAWLRGEPLAGVPPPSPLMVRATLIANLVVDGLANPIVEELYFRGFLLPRLGALGRAAPALNAALFALGHLWQPWNVPLIFTIVVVEAYAVRWRRSVGISILAHCAGNSIGAILALLG
jgi:uncharacterized protein